MRPNMLAPLLAFLAACPSCPPIDASKVAECKTLYDHCVAASKTKTEYEECRAEVDAQCLESGSGGHGGGK